jgi:hypothetical protein
MDVNTPLDDGPIKYNDNDASEDNVSAYDVYVQVFLEAVLFISMGQPPTLQIMHTVF